MEVYTPLHLSPPLQQALPLQCNLEEGPFPLSSVPLITNTQAFSIPILLRLIPRRFIERSKAGNISPKKALKTLYLPLQSPFILQIW